MGIIVLDDNDAARPRMRVILRFGGGLSDSAGIALTIGDSLPVLQVQCLQDDDPIDLGDLDLYLSLQNNRSTAHLEGPLPITDYDNAIGDYPLQSTDIAAAGRLIVIGKIDGTDGPVYSDPVVIPIRAL